MLSADGGFTLDEFGNDATGNWWAVAKQGYEVKYPGRPSLDEVKAYLDRFPLDGSDHFGGWYDKAENETYLDHTTLWGHKHTAILEAEKAGQKAIYNLKTGETLNLEFRLKAKPAENENFLLFAAKEAFSLLCSEDNPRYQDCIDTLDEAIQTARENR